MWVVTLINPITKEVIFKDKYFNDKRNILVEISEIFKEHDENVGKNEKLSIGNNTLTYLTTGKEKYKNKKKKVDISSYLFIKKKMKEDEEDEVCCFDINHLQHTKEVLENELKLIQKKIENLI